MKSIHTRDLANDQNLEGKEGILMTKISINPDKISVIIWI